MNNKAKKIVNAFAIVFFLVPIFAFAFVDPTIADCSFLSVGTAPCTGDAMSFTGSFWYRASPASGFYFAEDATYYLSFTYSGSGTITMGFHNDATDSLYAYTSSQVDTPIAMTPSGDGNTYSSFFVDDQGSFVGNISGVCISDHTGGCGLPPPPTPPASGIDAAVGVATSSFATTFGFDMDAVSIWMWDNLGQPILGSGIGTLYVMRFYWLGLIAISLIVFFAFLYFRFFKH